MAEEAPEQGVMEEQDWAWLCVCGHYQEDGFHCSACGCEPPWGCDCDLHDEDEYENDGGPLPSWDDDGDYWYDISEASMRDDWDNMRDDWMDEEAF